MRAVSFLLHAAVTTLKMVVDAIVSASWRLNIYGTNMAGLLLIATELESFWCSTKQSYHKLCKKNLSIRVPFFQQQICANVDSSTLLHLKNNYGNHLNPLAICTWLWLIAR